MEKKDYILREIEKIGVMIRFLIGKFVAAETTEQRNEVYGVVDDELKTNLDADIDSILNATQEEFDVLFVEKKGFNLENIELLANLFCEMAQSEIKRKKMFLMKSLELYDYIGKTGRTFSFEREEMRRRINYEIEHL